MAAALPVEFFTCGDRQQLITALLAPELLEPYQTWLAEDLQAIIERPLAEHVRAMLTACGLIGGYGFELLCAQQPSLADRLLTDIFLSARWRDAHLPVEATGGGLYDPTAGPAAGLLGTGSRGVGGALWCLQAGRLACYRGRQIDFDASDNVKDPTVF